MATTAVEVTTVRDVGEVIATPSADARVMVRWWWFGSSNTVKDVDQQLDVMVEAGIGGVELCCVYPVSPEQPTSYGTPKYLEVVRHASEGARNRGMRFDLTVGSGWSFGGAHIGQEHASKRLRFEDRAIGPNAYDLNLAGRWPGDDLVAAWVCDGAMGEHNNAYQAVTVANDIVHVPAGGSPRTLLLATSGPTTQQLKRASNGAEGPTLDHYSREATLHHLEAVGKPFFEAAGGSDLVTSIFCDSLEAYDADWTPTLAAEFTRRRGYDPNPFLYHLHTMQPEGVQLRCDYYKTLSELCEENCLKTCHDWAQAHGTKFRVQNYGAPPARISGYQYADMVEGEAWGWQKIPQSKWAASAAHHLGVNIVSSETWTWLNSPSFKARPLDFKGEAHEHVLCGINQFIGHGWPSSPLDTVDPGWAFYASCALSDRNAWWEAASKPLFAYLQRLSDVMRQGEHVADVGLWMPYEDTYANFVQEEELNLWRLSARRIPESIPRILRQRGYDYDCIDGQLSAETISRRHKVVLIAGCTLLSEEDELRLKEIAASGTIIIVVDSDVLPNALHVSLGDWYERLENSLEPDMSARNDAIAGVHRRLADGDLYFIANTGAEAQSFDLRPRTDYASWQSGDLHDGTVTTGTGTMKGVLAPYEAAVFVTTSSPGTASQSKSPLTESISLTHWSFSGPNGQTDVTTPHEWANDNFVGTASYTTTFDLHSNDPVPTNLVLDVSSLPTPPRTARRDQSFEAHAADPLGVVGVVTINGQRAGTFWDPPYDLPVRDFLKSGSKNTIRISISTASVAHMRNPEWRKIWEDAEIAHGRRFIMQEIDYAFEPRKSGLLVVPELRY